jgi:HK97 family phage major capsid protein
MTIKEMRERRGKLAADMAELANNLTAENRTKFDAMDAEQEDLRQQIERAERANQLELEMRTSRKPGEPPIGGPQDDDKSATEKKAERYQRAWVSYLKNGLNPDQYGFRGVTEEERGLLLPMKQTIQLERRDMAEGIPTGGAYPGSTIGFFVPVGFVNKIEEALKYYGDMWNQSEILDTATGQPLPYPTDNDTTVTGEIVGEGQQVSTADVSLGQIVFSAYKFSTKMVKVSIELLQDSAFDIEGFLQRKFATRLGRITNTKFTKGGGPSNTAGSPPVAAPEPTGIMTAAVSSGQTVIGDDNATTPDPTQQIGYIDLVNLEHSVDPLYRRGAKYMFHDSTLRFLKTLKDKYGRPLWVPAIAAGNADTVNGYSYSVNNDMDQLGHSNKAVAFGALDKYMIRRVKELSVLRLTERFADYGQVAFLGFARYDGNLLDAGTHPVKYLQNS